MCTYFPKVSVFFIRKTGFSRQENDAIIAKYDLKYMVGLVWTGTTKKADNTSSLSCCQCPDKQTCQHCRTSVCQAPLQMNACKHDGWTFFILFSAYHFYSQLTSSPKKVNHTIPQQPRLLHNLIPSQLCFYLFSDIYQTQVTVKEGNRRTGSICGYFFLIVCK